MLMLVVTQPEKRGPDKISYICESNLFRPLKIGQALKKIAKIMMLLIGLASAIFLALRPKIFLKDTRSRRSPPQAAGNRVDILKGPRRAMFDNIHTHEHIL